MKFIDTIHAKKGFSLEKVSNVHHVHRYFGSLCGFCCYPWQFFSLSYHPSFDIYQEKRLYYVLLNLAILDASTTILAIYKTIINGSLNPNAKSHEVMRVYNQTRVGAEIMCKFYQAFWIGSWATPTFLLIIAYERHKAIVKPLSRSSGISNRKLGLLILLSWVSGCAPILVHMVGTNVGIEGCRSFLAEWYNFTIYTSTIVLLLFLLPTVVMSVLYYKVIKAIKRDEQLGIQAAVQRAREASRRKVVAMIITVTILFYAFCGIPIVTFAIREFFGFRLWNDSVQTLLYSTNSLANPLIYVIFLKSFRNALKSMFTCHTVRNDQSFKTRNNQFAVHLASYDNVKSQGEKHIELLNINHLPSL